MKTKRLFGVLFLLIALIIAGLPLPKVEAISSPSDFQMQGTVLIKYLGSDSAVTIPDGVTEIGAESFSDCSFIEEISIPNSVTKIDDMAFSGCSGLKVCTIPDGVLSLGTYAFNNCTSLVTMYFGDSLSTIGEGIFVGCTSLEKIIVSDLNTNFVRDEGLLYSYDKTKVWFLCPGSDISSYEMPNTVTTIAKYAFWGCENLQEVYLSTSMDTISDYSFMNCIGLEQVHIPYNITSIGMKAFAYCTGLQTITIPMSVKEIHETAFDGCTNSNVSDESGEYAKNFFVEQAERISPTSYYPISSDEESSGDTSEDVTTGESDDEAVLGTTHIVAGNAMVIIKNADGSVVTGYNSQIENLYGKDWQNEFISENVLSRAAFYLNSALTNITLPEDLKKIDDFSFARSGLTYLLIPDSVTEIGYAAFYHCDDLSEVAIPSSVSKIGAYAFDHTAWMDQFMENSMSDYLIVGNGILIAYKGASETITIPQEVKSISAFAFANHTEIKQILGGENLENVDPDAFYGCTVSVEQISSSMNLTNSINEHFAVVYTVEYHTKESYILFKWILVFILLLIGMILSFHRRTKRSA